MHSFASSKFLFLTAQIYEQAIYSTLVSFNFQFFLTALAIYNGRKDPPTKYAFK